MRILDCTYTEVTEAEYNHYFKHDMDLNYYYEYRSDGKESYIYFIAKSMDVKVYVLKKVMPVAGKETKYFINEALIEEFDCETF